MNIIDYPGMILTKDELWKEYNKLDYNQKESVSEIIGIYSKREVEKRIENFSNFKVVR